MPKLGNKHFAYTPEGQAAYKKAKATKAAKKPSSIGGPPSEEKAERQMGADAYIKKEVTGFKVAEHATLKEAQSALADVLSESDISDYFPNPVWNKASNKLVAQMWAMHKKSSQTKGPKKMHRMPNGKMMAGASHGK
jgi:hypothetical protein